MKNKIIFVVGMLVMVLVLIYVVSLTNTNQAPTEGVKSKEAPQAYVNKDKPTAIYIEGNPEPVLRIEDLPKEFPPHIQHYEGDRFPDTRFNLASLSPDGEKIAFSCGVVHNWVGVFELKSKKIHVITWLFDTPIDHIVWSPNSQYFVYAYGAPNDEYVVKIVGHDEKTAEPHITNSWRSKMEDFVWSISELRWTKDGDSLLFNVQNYEIRNGEVVRLEGGPAKTITLKSIKEKEEVKEPPKKVKRTN